MDQTEMTALERLAAIPLDASVAHHTKDGWVTSEAISKADLADLGAFIDKATAAKSTAPRTLQTSAGKAIALVKPLPVLTGGETADLVLSYPWPAPLAPIAHCWRSSPGQACWACCW
uniref:Uncharacterized protein n=1 Tax=Phenylobacterium glaciei TaxID=2803784 RepID=A0A974P405_9CAUL|nr:hypothetical protein JKL49_25885 [Phenylobacterium glaciei]